MVDKKGEVFDPKNMESLVFKWGTQQWIVGDRFSLGLTVIPPSTAHDRHNHPGVEESFYIISGEMEVIFYYGDKQEKFYAGPGCYVHIPPGVEHSGGGHSTEPVRFLVIYSPAGPETYQLRNDPACTILPPGKLPAYYCK